MSEDKVLVDRDTLIKVLDRLDCLEKDLESLKKKIQAG